MSSWPKWKILEKKVADYLGWERKVRANNYAISDTDILPPPKLDFLKIDCKNHARLRHHTLIAEVERKYCESPLHEPVLITRETTSGGAKKGVELPIYVTIRLSFFRKLIKLYENAK